MSEEFNTITAFNGDNYTVWKQRITDLLTEKDLWHLVNQSAPEDDGGNELELHTEFWDNQNKAKCIIRRFMTDDYIHMVKSSMTVKCVFESMDKIYQRKSLSARLLVLRKLSRLKYSGGDFRVHINTFSRLCEDMAIAGRPMDKVDKISHLYNTLPNSFDEAILSINLDDDNLTVESIYHTLIGYQDRLNNEEEMRKMLPIDGEPENLNELQSKEKPKKISRCFHCKKKGHVLKMCRFKNSPPIYFQGQKPYFKNEHELH